VSSGFPRNIEGILGGLIRLSVHVRQRRRFSRRKSTKVPNSRGVLAGWAGEGHEVRRRRAVRNRTVRDPAEAGVA